MSRYAQVGRQGVFGSWLFKGSVLLLVLGLCGLCVLPISSYVSVVSADDEGKIEDSSQDSGGLCGASDVQVLRRWYAVYRAGKGALMKRGAGEGKAGLRGVLEGRGRISGMSMPRFTSAKQGLRKILPGMEGITEEEARKLGRVRRMSVDWESFSNLELRAMLVEKSVDSGKVFLGAKSGGQFDNLNLRASVATFVTFLNLSDSAEVVDLNGASLDEDGVAYGEPNGVPDLAEFLVLEGVLKDDTVDLSASGGLTHAALATRWLAASALFDTAMIPVDVPAGVVEVLTAYIVLGDPLSVYMAAVLADEAGIEFAEEETFDIILDTSLVPLISSQGDMDGDTFSNLLEWQEAAVLSTFEQNFAAYYAAALDVQTIPAGDFVTMTRSWSGWGVYPYPIAEKYRAGTPLEIMVVPEEDWVFEKFEIFFPGTGMDAIPVKENPTTFPMDSDVEVQIVALPVLDATTYFADVRLETAVRAAVGKLTGTLYWRDLLQGNLTALDASGLGITSLEGIHYCLDLQTLDLSNNAFSEIDYLEGLTNLTALNLSENQLSATEFLSSLSHLSDLTQLETLLLGSAGENTDSPVAEVATASNTFTDISGLATLTNLKTLELTGCAVTDISALQSLTNLEKLYLSKVAVGDFSYLGGLTQLTELTLQETGLTDADMTHLANMTALEWLLLGGNSLTSLSVLADCSALEILEVSGNASLSNMSPLQSCTSLWGVLANNCAISNVSSFASAVSLQGLILENNQIVDMAPLNTMSLYSLESVNVLGNPLGTQALCTDIPAMIARGVAVDYEGACGTGYTLTAAASPASAGELWPFVGSRMYEAGNTVELCVDSTALPYTFSHWSGDVEEEQTDWSCVTVVMDSDKSVTANFLEAQWIVTILPPEGVGQCTETRGYKNGATACISAQGGVGWVFSHWLEGETVFSTDSSYCFDINSDLTLKAVFVPAETMLHIGHNAGGRTSPEAGTYYYLTNDEVSLYAYSDENYFFDYWWGDLRGYYTPSSIVMDGNKTINATFSLIGHDMVVFSDENLRALVLTALGKTSGPIYTDDLIGTNFMTLDASNAGITNLGGLEYCRDLRSLNLSGNTITDLTPLEKLGKLYSLSLSDMQPDNWEPLGELGSLSSLTITGCALTDEDTAFLAKLKNLTRLDLSDNQIQTLVVLHGLTKLVHLELAHNQIYDLCPLCYCVDLDTLNVSYNNLSAIDCLGLLEQLRVFYAEHNQITSAGALYGRPSLEYIQLSHNQLTDIQSLGTLPSIHTIILDDNPLEDISNLVYNPDLNAGGYVSLNDTALTHRSACWGVDQLRARDVTVRTNIKCTFNLTTAIIETGNATDANSITPTPDGADYERDSTANISAHPGYHWRFQGWTGDLTSALRNETLTMDTDKSVTASFIQQHEVSRDIPLDLGSGTVMVGPHGGQSTEITGSPSQHHLFDHQTVVQLQATPDPGWQFDSWGGDLTDTTLNPNTFAITSDINLTARFIQEGRLTITVSPAGAGNVALYKNGNTTPEPTAPSYPIIQGDTLRLDASANSGDWQFSHFAGVPNGATNPCTWTFPHGGARAIQAIFIQRRVYITSSQGGTLTVKRNGTAIGGPGQYPAIDGDTFTIHATPDPDWRFQHYTGVILGSTFPPTTTNPLTLTISQDTVIQASFAVGVHTLTSGAQTPGGYVTATPPNTDSFPIVYTYGDSVTLSAMPNPHYHFTGWTGDLATQPSTAVLTMNRDITAYATFELDQYTLNLTCDTTQGDVTVESNGVSHNSPYTFGWNTPLTLKATPSIGYRFDHWSVNSGAAQYASPLTFPLAANTSVEAVFVEHHLPGDLQHFVDYLRGIDRSLTPPDLTLGSIDTLALLVADCNNILNQIDDVDWEVWTLLAISQVLPTLNIDQTAIDTTGLFNLNPDTKGYHIPDVLEFFMLERVLEDQSHPLHAEAWSAWLSNLALWLEYNDTVAAQLPNFTHPDYAVVCALATYSTLSLETALNAAALYIANLVQRYGIVPQPPSWSEFTYLDAVYHQDGDFDGDGFTNLEEYVFQDMEDGFASFTTWTDTPGFFHALALSTSNQLVSKEMLLSVNDPEATGTPPSVKVTLQDEGNGALTPFEGTKYILTYSPLDWPPNSTQTDCPDCEVNTLPLTAQADTDWTFLYWQDQWHNTLRIANFNNMAFQKNTGGIPFPDIQLPLDADVILTAFFEERSELTDLNLISDLGIFLESIGELTSAQEVSNMQWDRGDLFFDEAGNPTYTENGIPDAAEFALLEHVLLHPEINLSASGGVVNEIVYENFTRNHARATVDISSWSNNLNNPQPPARTAAIINVIAAYMTLGYYGATDMICHEIKELTSGIALDSSNYAIGALRYFAPDNDCDNDGLSNIGEWHYTLDSVQPASQSFAKAASSSTSNSASQETAESYSSNASDGTAPSGYQPPTGECVTCENDECNNAFTSITLHNTIETPNGESSRLAIRVTGYTNGCETVTIGENSSVAVRVGREVTVTAETIDSEFATFRCWNAPDLPIHGSDQSVETFVVPKSTNGYDIRATAVKKWETTLFLPADNVPDPARYHVYNGRVEAVYNEYDQYIGANVTTPQNDLVTVSYSLPCPDGVVWELANNDTIGDVLSYGSSVTVLDKGDLLELTPSCASCIGDDGCNTKTSTVSSTIGTPLLTPGGTLNSETSVSFVSSLTRYRGNNISCPLLIIDPETLCGYQYDKTIKTANGSGGTHWHHTLKPAHTLTLVPRKCKGYVTTYPAQKYYDDNEVVEISAHALPGYTFVGWQGNGTAWLLEVFDTLFWEQSLSSITSSSIYVKMNQSRTIQPVFVEPKIVNFRCTSEKLNIYRQHCNSGTSGGVIFEYCYDSSTGKLSDLTGVTAEVVCLDNSVALGDVFSWLTEHEFSTSMLQGPEWVNGEISAPWGADFIPPIRRFFVLKTSSASSGYGKDNHSFSIPRQMSETAGSYTKKQWYIHIPECGEPYAFAGPFNIVRTSYGDGRVSLKKTGGPHSGTEHYVHCEGWVH